jgi:glycosyltransferase involved in cell wall biosynthesis
MILGIDAFNLKDGGGVTHLVELLKVAKPSDYGFKHVVVWGNKKLLLQIDDRPWLIKENKYILERNIIYRMFWHLFLVKKEASKNNCSVLFCPGGVSRSSFKPSVTMSRNMLPFELKELFRFGFSFMTLKLLIIRMSQKKSFVKSQGVIFLTNYAKKIVTKAVNISEEKIALIPHGVTSILNGRKQRNNLGVNKNHYNIIYVSHFRPYKHHLKVATAIVNLRKKGFEVSIDFIGSKGRGFNDFFNFLNMNDPNGNYLKYHGKLDRNKMEKFYLNSDICLFASSCENMPNILLESMGAAKPIACSDKMPMNEFLKEGGIYFNASSVNSIFEVLEKMLNSLKSFGVLNHRNKEELKKYTWNKTSSETFKFLINTLKSYNNV